VVTRRALLAGGGAALLAGCGAQKETVVAPADLLGRSLRAETHVAAAYAVLSTTDRARVGRLAASASARRQSLRAAFESAGGTSAPAAATSGGGLGAVLRAEQAALRAHVAGVGLTTDQNLRDLLAGLVAGSAGSAAALMALVSRDPVYVAFPGEPA
jgi:hypothetical protein